MKNLEYFEEEFQYEALKALIEDRTLIGRVYKVLDQNAFSTAALRLIVTVIKDFYKSKTSAIDYVSLNVLTKERCANEYDLADVKTAIACIKSADLIGQDSIEEHFIKFFKLKHLVKIANKIIEDVQGNDRDDLIIQRGMKGFEDIAKLGEDTSEVVLLNTDTMTTAMIEEKDGYIPTGIKELDEALVGGLGRQEIGLFVAPTGYGKTTAGTIFAHNASTLGFKVLQIFFEDKPNDIIRKHLAASTNLNSNRFKNMGAEEAKDFISALSETELSFTNNLILCKMPDAETTVEDIDTKIRELINQYGFHPDMIVIDYFSSLKHSANLNRDPNEAQTRCMKKIKEMIAYKYNAAVWVMQQTNRTGVQKDGDSSGMGNWQGAYAATQPASVWITLQRTKEQRANCKADLIFNKTRHSQPAKDLYNITFDNGRLQIDCKDSLEYDDLEFHCDYEKPF